MFFLCFSGVLRTLLFVSDNQKVRNVHKHVAFLLIQRLIHTLLYRHLLHLFISKLVVAVMEYNITRNHTTPVSNTGVDSGLFMAGATIQSFVILSYCVSFNFSALFQLLLYGTGCTGCIVVLLYWLYWLYYSTVVLVVLVVLLYCCTGCTVLLVVLFYWLYELYCCIGCTIILLYCCTIVLLYCFTGCTGCTPSHCFSVFVTLLDLDVSCGEVFCVFVLHRIHSHDGILTSKTITC